MPPASGLQSIERFGVPIAMVVAIIFSVAMLASSNSEKFSKLEHSIDMLRIEVKTLSGQVTSYMTESQARAWIAEFRAANPTLTVPNLFTK